ncbi:dynein axonemal heavy chain 11-like [Pyxicephalus adspersus]
MTRNERITLHYIETMIIQWTHQITDILTRDSAHKILQGEHSGPSHELEFWTMQKENLLSVRHQLQTTEFQKVIIKLQDKQSSYCTGFMELINSVDEALTEAKEIELYLKPLKFYIAHLEESKFPDIEGFFLPLFHTIFLIWTNSLYYCTPQRVIVLLQEFCNLLIDRSENFLISEEIFKMELEEGLERVQMVVQMFQCFKKTYLLYVEKVAIAAKNSERIQIWDFPSSLVFFRFDSVLERLLFIEELFTAAIDFLKLEKIEIGGFRGKILSEEIHIMSEESNEIWRMLQEGKYDPLDYTDAAFLSDYTKYRQQINGFDHHLGQILNLAFDESNGLESAFKGLQIFGTLLDRPVINTLFCPNYVKLITMFEMEINSCKKIYLSQKEAAIQGNSMLHKNMPVVAGNLKWSQELRERLMQQRLFFKHINHESVTNDEANRVFEKYNKFIELLDAHDEETFTSWTQDLCDLCESHLGQPILRRDEHGLYETNFNSKLAAILREVKYLQFLHFSNIPEMAKSLYVKRKTFQKHIGNLDLIAQWFNRLQKTILQVEKELIHEELQQIYEKLEPALSFLTWQMPDLDDYIEEARDLVYNLDNRILKAKQNVEVMHNLINKLRENNLIGSRQGKSLGDKDRMGKQYSIAEDVGQKIQALLKHNQELFKADSLSDKWKSYTEYIDHMILEGLFQAVKCSVQYLTDNTEFCLRNPLFKVELLLNGVEMSFVPSLDKKTSGNLYNIIEGLLQDTYRIASFIPRVAIHLGQQTYQLDVDEMEELKEMHGEIMRRVHSTIVNVKEYQKHFKKYSYLWTDDKTEFMKQFLQYGRFLSAEEMELYADYELQECAPQLEHFKKQINIYESLYHEVEKFEIERTFNGWLLVDMKPFKISLMNTIKRWSLMFKDHLLNLVTCSVNDFDEFIHRTEKGLGKKVKAEDYEGLVETMGHLLAIRDRLSTEDNFRYLKATSELLRSNGQQLPEHISTQLEELPERWKNLKKIAFIVKHEVSPLQANEVSVIRRKCVLFEVKQHEYRNRFKNEFIFKFDAEDPYKHLDKTSIKDWMKTPWKQINVEQMDMELRRFAKEMKSLDKEVRTWDVYLGLESTVKNLITSLRAVNELQNPAVRMRHWLQLMSKTGVKFVMNEETVLGDLLVLQLHRVEDEVKNIVDKAVKEMAIEKVLVEMNHTWSTMQFSYEKHSATGTPLLKSDEDLIETLEDNQKMIFCPCAMVIPDFELICEIMLVAEGFVDARMLSRKFISLYTLCRQLLSKQDHYDWGLRAIKSVLVVAGSLKREDRSRPEDQVLMRALRDFNLPKIVTNDVAIFLGLINDLFPLLEVPRKRDVKLEQMVRQSIAELRLQPEENFILKITQLEELLEVRHSVFVVGNAGTGKSTILRTLHRTYFNMRLKPVWHDINPKAVTTDELFGFLHPSTREWKDGLFSFTMRELFISPHDGPKWIVLDGDIDPMWIESLNTVMDDNKVLTLASNERISLTPSMRLLFEISHLRAATPATVSRAGILYVNTQDLGWSPHVTSWIETRQAQSEKANLTILFDKYVPYCLEQVRCNLKTITPIPENSMVQTLCSLLDCLLTAENTPPDSPRELYETYFVFACVWSFGGALFQDQLLDYRLEFSRWWNKEMRTIKFPSSGTVFDYFIDPETKKFTPWTDRIPEFEMTPDIPLQTVLVHTSETIRLRFFLDLLLEKGKPIMLVGNAGVGKTILVSDKLAKLPEDYMVAKVPFNYYTTSAMLQRVLEKPLEKRAGRNYSPPGTKKLVYFIDDLNMPEVDAFSTVQPHTLIRQHLDYSHWYDRQKLVAKEIHNCQYITCMNPTAGSFSINPRLQRHFSVFAVHFPGSEALTTIYSRIISAHFQHGGFSYSVMKSLPTLIQSAIYLHHKMTQNFLPTAIRFHYIFNLRDLTHVFQGMLFASPECIRFSSDLVHLWLHESCRVYSDKLMEEKDIEHFKKVLIDTAKRFFEGVDEHIFINKPLVYCHFAHGVGEPRYFPISDWEKLTRILTDALEHYNEIHAAMNLVLFEEAIQHICRISRILEFPYGNALLIGVGGSGKQSLCRLAAFLSSLEVFQITLRKGYSINDLRSDIATLYFKVGIKNIGTVFLHTDAQIPDERFLVLINDMLASGEIPDLFSEEEMDNIVSSVRMELRALGLPDSRDNCWQFFIDRIRRQLKVVLCFSPVGFTLRTRARKFPALVNCTAIDWFHSWPPAALQSVSSSFIHKLEGVNAQVKNSISQFITFAHTSVNEVSIKYQQNEKHYNYTTPKSFLELIKLYWNLLGKKRGELLQKIERLENGLQKLQTTAFQVEDLKSKLAVQEVELHQRNRDTEALIDKIGQQTEKLNQEKSVADAEERKVAALQAEITKQQQESADDLAKAEPALQAANAALNTLNRLNLTELRTFPNPPAAVTNVAAAVLVLLCPNGKIPKDRSWKAAKVLMSKVDEFQQNLVHFEKEHIPDATVKTIKDDYLKDPEFNPEFVRTKSSAAAGLCAWVINIIKYHEVYCEVDNKRQSLSQANTDLIYAAEKLDIIRKKLEELDTNLAALTAAFERATAEKIRCQEEVNRTNKTIELANRLVKGLESENIRWAQSVALYRKQEQTLCGDVLLTAAFISYAGSFSKKYRHELIEYLWMPFLRSQKFPVPMTEGLDPICMLADDATIAKWNNEGLPSDTMSIQNGTILSNCERWPLMIDPQLQGIKWIKSRYGSRLKVIHLGQKGYVDVIEQAVSAGDPVLIENLEESIDPVLDNLLGRHMLRRGRSIRIGDKECKFHPKFRLILHTKLANPHYKPEIQAQTTLINFTVTRDGLEDQLLADVVNLERPDLEHFKSELTKQQNYFKIELKMLEDELLTRLSAAESNFLGDTLLVEKLETTKHTAAEIEMKVLEAKVNEVKINEAREHYRHVASRASLLYFIMNDLKKISPMYQFSLKAFNTVFHKAVQQAEPSDDVRLRVNNLIDCVTYSTFIYISRGLFEKDKITFTAQLVFQLLIMNKEISAQELDFLLRFNVDHIYNSPLDFLSNSAWSAIKTMSFMDEFRGLDRDIEGSPKRWKRVIESECPERERLPQEWKNKSSLQKMILMRALRPDRMTYAIRNFVEEKLGAKYVERRNTEFARSFQESGPATPIVFILSPGVDPLKDVETLGDRLGFTIDSGKLHNISLGQGQEVIAEIAMEKASKEGHWVILQNIHLVAKWLSVLEKLLEKYSNKSHPDYRVFMSAEPAPTPKEHIIPQGILENAIKITNEPATGMLANLHAALDNFDQNILDQCTREQEFKSIFFSLCYFHACVAERRKFGPQGWNRKYPFNIGDLTISVNVLYNYLEANSQVPWEDLRYLFGEIMYGGHITDDWDRRLCCTYLEEYMQPNQFDRKLALAPGFVIPSNLDYEGYHRYIDEMLPPESPIHYGLHPNAEIEFLTVTSDNLFRTLLELQSRDSISREGAPQTEEEKVKTFLDDILDKLPEGYNMSDITSKTTERSPYILVCFQECERMNFLLHEIRRSLKELDLGLKGELAISSEMEQLQSALFFDTVPDTWTKLAYPSTYSLAQWYSDLLLRCRELDAWTQDLCLPSVVWISGFFNPQSFLTAVMQSLARKNEWPLDKMHLTVDVMKKYKEEFSQPAREGAYIHGLFLEGAQWDIQGGHIAEARLKAPNPIMPVIFVRAIPNDRQDTRNMYECPVYKTKIRGSTYVWAFHLKTKERPSKWILAGVALLLSV